MFERPRESSSLFYCILLCSVIYLLYSTSVNSEYLMNDELAHISMNPGEGNFEIERGFMTGRLLGAKIHTATYLFVGKSVFRLQIVRFISLVLIVGAAVALFIFLLRQNVHGFLAILLLIFFFSQKGFQAYSAYSLETFHQIICFPIGMAAFYLAFYYDPQTRVGEIVKYSFVFLLLMSTALIMQSLLFFSLIPVAFLILRDDWKNNQKKIQILVWIQPVQGF